MRIAIFASEIPSTAFIENLIKGLAMRGHTIYVYGKYIKNPHYENYNNIHTVKEPKSKLGMSLYALKYILKLLINNPRKLLWLLKVSKAQSYLYWVYRFNLYASIAVLEVDIFHIQWVNSLLYIDSFVEHKIAKTVVSFRGTHLNSTPLYLKACREAYERVFPQVDGFHGVSNAIIEEAKKYDIALGERAHVAYPAVTSSTLARFKVTTKHAKTEFHAISIGRHHWKKGYNYAFDAVKILKDKEIPIIYTIVAHGTLDEQLVYQINELGIQDQIKITGGLSHDKVLDTAQNSDVFLLPSLEEGVANVVLEAMAIGTPVVSTDCGGMLEVIKDGVNGYIVKSGYSNLLAEALEKVYNLNAEHRKNLIINAHQTIKEKHTLETQLNEMEKLYHKVLES